MLFSGCAGAEDGGLTLEQHWVNDRVCLVYRPISSGAIHDQHAVRHVQAHCSCHAKTTMKRQHLLTLEVNRYCILALQCVL